MMALKRSSEFKVHQLSKTWPGDIVFYPTCQIFEYGIDIVKMIILTMFHQDWYIIVFCVEFDSFLPKMNTLSLIPKKYVVPINIDWYKRL